MELSPGGRARPVRFSDIAEARYNKPCNPVYDPTQYSRLAVAARMQESAKQLQAMRCLVEMVRRP